MTYRYVPAPLYRLGQLALLTEAGFRGANYFFAPRPQTAPIEVLGLSAPVAVWGFLFIAMSIIGLTGEVLMDKGNSEHRWWPSFLAHSGLMCLFAALALAASVAVAQGGVGVLVPVDFAVFALWHWIFARRRKDV